MGKITQTTKDCLSYSATEFASKLMHSVFMFYYVKIFITHYKVGQEWFQVSQIIFMIWNAINDPIFGYFQDTSSWKCFKSRRLSVLYGAPLFAISFLIPWFPWGSANVDVWVFGIQLTFALCFYDALFTFVVLAHCCLLTEMCCTYKKRMTMKWYSIIATLCSAWAVAFINLVSDNMSNMVYFRLGCVFLAVIALIAMTITGCTAYTVYDQQMACEQTEENIKGDSAKSNKGETPWKLTFQVLKDRDFEAFVWTNFAQIFHVVFFSNFTAILVDNLTDIASTAKSFYFGMLFVLPSLIFILAQPIFLRIGYYKLILANCYFKITAPLIIFLTGLNTYTYLGFILLDTILAHVSGNLYDLVLSDIADKNMQIHKRSHPISSTIFGTNALVTKPAISLSPMLAVAVLNWYGYADQASSPAHCLKRGMFLLSCAVPFFVGLVQLCTWSLYTMRKTHVSIEVTDSGKDDSAVL